MAARVLVSTVMSRQHGPLPQRRPRRGRVRTASHLRRRRRWCSFDETRRAPPAFSKPPDSLRPNGRAYHRFGCTADTIPSRGFSRSAARLGHAARVLAFPGHICGIWQLSGGHPFRRPDGTGRRLEQAPQLGYEGVVSTVLPSSNRLHLATQSHTGLARFAVVSQDDDWYGREPAVAAERLGHRPRTNGRHGTIEDDQVRPTLNRAEDRMESVWRTPRIQTNIHT